MTNTFGFNANFILKCQVFFCIFYSTRKIEFVIYNINVSLWGLKKLLPGIWMNDWSSFSDVLERIVNCHPVVLHEVGDAQRRRPMESIMLQS